jgi:hypothetical protein
MKDRNHIVSIDTDHLGTVLCYEDTFVDHIQKNHPDMEVEHIQNALLSPVAICEGTSNSDYVIFVGEYKTPSGSPICVFVNPGAAPSMVVTASYRRDFKSLSDKNKLWLRTDD